MKKIIAAALTGTLFFGVPVLLYAQSALPSIEELIQKAESGDAESQWRLGSRYETGQGVRRDIGMAEQWYRRAAEGGYAEAQNSVGSIHQERREYAAALPWFEKASKQGHALATNNLAYLYDLGRGVPQDRRKGFEFYSRAADLGWAEAMWNIANMYGAGQLGKTDLVAACTWVVRTRRFADPKHQALQAHIRRALPQLERMLSPDQLATCRADGESWNPQPRKAVTNAQPDAATDRRQAGGR